MIITETFRPSLTHLSTLTLLALCFVLAPLASSAEAQIAPPSGPVTFCFSQAPPPATTHEVAVDGAAYAPLTVAATPDARCPAAATHSFTLPAALFTVGQHTVQLRSINAFGATEGPRYTVEVGIAPGAATILAVIPPGA